MNTPVALIVFNRPEQTRQVLDTIRQAKPDTLFVIADGPRPDVPSDAARCDQVRSMIDTVDWDCNLLKDYADDNMGCEDRVSSGLTWVFETVPEAIILEDDCLPDPSFFQFCTELLNRYRHDESIMHISGFNPLHTWKEQQQSYHYALYGSVWGWASWSRAWKHYDADMQEWIRPEVRNRIQQLIANRRQYRKREKINWRTYRKEIDSWAYPWLFTRMLCNGLSIVPSYNLVRNIGFANDSTHTKDSQHALASVDSYSMPFPLVHPAKTTLDPDLDSEIFRTSYSLSLRDYFRYGWMKVRRYLSVG